jgi:hypothetical protein
VEEDELVSFDNDRYCLSSDDSREIQLVVVEKRFLDVENDKKAWYPIGKLKIYIWPVNSAKKDFFINFLTYG